MGEFKSKAQIYRPEDCIEEMKRQLRVGKVKGTTTHNSEVDKCWTWRKKEANIWTGYANEGKSLFFKSLALIKALKENWVFAFSSPEDFPAEEFYDDMIHTLTGQTTDRDYPNVISSSLYEEAYKIIKDLFIFVYMPVNSTIEDTLLEFKHLCKNQKIDACIIDPLLKFKRPLEYERDDLYASYVGGLFVEFSRITNTSAHLVMHQVTPIIDGMSKKYSEPSMYRVKGGGSWSDGFDNVLSVWRPHYSVDKIDTEVQFSSQKIKKQKLVGIPQRMQLRFDRKSNRYINFHDYQSIFDFDSIMYNNTKGLMRII